MEEKKRNRKEYDDCVGTALFEGRLRGKKRNKRQVTKKREIQGKAADIVLP